MDISNDNLFEKISAILEQARKQVATVANLAMVHSYFEIGRTIVEDEQDGNLRATYGKKTLKELSKKLNHQFGKGFSVENLERMRYFYKTYQSSISSTLFTKFENIDIQDIKFIIKPEDNLPTFHLSWSHYLILMRIENPEERKFYEIEAKAQNWSVAQLKRQFHTSLYERLALSRNKEEVLKLSQQGHVIEKPVDFLKNPLTLDFLGLEEKNAYSENDLETGIINKIQDFLLELGKGFLFESRQKRFSFDNEHFYIDLVFYNRLLQCYVLIDLKITHLSHQDLGQMQMYVNYYDRFVKLDYEKPTVGILLCKKKNTNLVELTLPKEANIYATEYSLYLPKKEVLQQKLNEWIEELDEENNEN
jgi:predicted nuclease of restriction endonuclease-like (RecB) superfamily